MGFLSPEIRANVSTSVWVKLRIDFKVIIVRTFLWTEEASRRQKVEWFATIISTGYKQNSV